MIEWFTQVGVYLIAAAIVLIGALVCVFYGAFGDRSRGRARCPKCWYDMRGRPDGAKGLVCPECSHNARRESRLYRRRRRWKLILPGLLFAVLAAYPLVVVAGWYYEQSTVRAIERVGGKVVVTPLRGARCFVHRLPAALATHWNRVHSVQIVLVAPPEAPERLADLKTVSYLPGAGPPRNLVIPNADTVHLHVSDDDILNYHDKTRATDTDLVLLDRLWHLESLTLYGRCVTGRTLENLNRLSGLRKLTLGAVGATDEDLSRLTALQRLRCLDLCCTELGDQGMVHVGRLKGLEELWLSSAVTDAGLSSLEGLHALRRLYVRGGVSIGGVSARARQRLREKSDGNKALRWLLHESSITDVGLIHLRGLAKLEYLSLAGTGITDNGLVHLKGLNNIRELHLSNTRVSDAGLVYLAGLTKLEVVGLSATEVTDAGLIHLEELTHLRKLYLWRTSVTDQGLVPLTRKRPNLRVWK